MNNVFEYWNIFVNCFTKASDYRTESDRKELIVFLVFELIILMILPFVLFFLTLLLYLTSVSPIVVAIIPVISFVIYFIAYIIPYFALIKRRLNSLWKNKASIIFRLYIGLIFLKLVFFVLAASGISSASLVTSTLEQNNITPILICNLLVMFCNTIEFAFVVFLLFRKKPLR